MRDMLSNELEAGDLVHVKVGNEWLGAIIVKVQNGGLSLGISNPTAKNGAPQLTADVVIIQMPIPLGGQPGQPQPFIVRLDKKAQTDQIIESTLKM